METPPQSPAIVKMEEMFPKTEPISEDELLEEYSTPVSRPPRKRKQKPDPSQQMETLKQDFLKTEPISEDEVLEEPLPPMAPRKRKQRVSRINEDVEGVCQPTKTVIYQFAMLYPREPNEVSVFSVFFCLCGLCTCCMNFFLKK